MLARCSPVKTAPKMVIDGILLPNGGVQLIAISDENMMNGAIDHLIDNCISAEAKSKGCSREGKCFQLIN